MRRAIFGLRWAGLSWLVGALGTVALSVWQHLLVARAWDPDARPGLEELESAFRTYSFVSTSVHTLLGVLACVGLGLLAFGLRGTDGRRLGWAALAACVVGQAGAIVLRLVGAFGEMRLERESTAFVLYFGVWHLVGLALATAQALALLAVARSTRAARSTAQIAAGLVAVFAMAALAANGAQTFAKPEALATMQLLVWVVRGLDVTLELCASIGALVVAAKLADGRTGGDAEQTAGEPGGEGALASERAQRAGASALRLLVTAVLLRVGVGILGPIALVAATASKSFASAQALIVLVAGISTLLALLVAFALVGQLRLPEEGRSAGAIAVALGGLLLGTLVDGYAAVTGAELFAIADKARRAASLWSMPSLSRIEELRSSLEWGGRIAVLLGLGATLALVHSMRTTARWLADEESCARANHATWLVIVGGLGAIGLGALRTSGLRADSLLLVLFGFGSVLLVIGIAALVTLVRLGTGLARGVERSAAMAASSDAEPR